VLALAFDFSEPIHFALDSVEIGSRFLVFALHDVAD